MQLSKLNIISSVALLVLGGGVFLTVQLAQQNQENRSRASGLSGITYVRSAKGESCSGSISATLSGVTSGNLIVVGVTNENGSVMVSDNKGNLYTKAISSTSGDASGIWYASGVVGGTVTVTARPSSSGCVTVVPVEYSGAAVTSVLDKTSLAAGTGTAVSSGNTSSTTQAQELVFGVMSFSNYARIPITAGSGFAMRQSESDNVGPEAIGVEDQSAPTIGAANPTFILGQSASWKGIVSTFKPVTSAVVPTAMPLPTSTPVPTLALAPTATPIPQVLPTATNIPGVPTAIPTQIPAATPTPVVTSGPVPTPLTGTTSLRLSLRLHGIGSGGDNVNPSSLGNFSPAHPVRTATVSLYDVHNQLVVNQVGNVSFDAPSGTFIGNVDLGTSFVTGSYTVKVKADQYLRTLIPGIQTITANQSNILPSVALVTGDTNNDNQVNIVDYNMIVGCYSDLQAPVDCAGTNNLLADITDDGHVNQFDYNLFLRELTNIGGQ